MHSRARKDSGLLSAAQRQLSLHDILSVYRGSDLRLDQIGKTVQDAGFDADDFAGFGGAEDFYAAHRREFKCGHGRNLRIALRDRSGKLGGGFDEQHAGKERLAGKVSAQKWFIATDGVFSCAAFTRLQVQQAVNEPKLRPVRQEFQCLLPCIIHNRLFLFQGLHDFVVARQARCEQ